MRCDVYLFEKGYVKSRSQASGLIREGKVMINGRSLQKPSETIDETQENVVEILGRPPFVSRGGLKLEHALNTFRVDVTDLCVLDIGASTGGFTDCLLRHGAASVIALDSGEGQLDASLREDARVICIEKYNARYMKPEDLPILPDMAVMDVSFISQILIFPSVSTVLKSDGLLISLIKPQFEVGKSGVGKGGIVKHSGDRRAAVQNVLLRAQEHGLGCFALTYSPIAGGDGNVEFLAAFQKGRPMTIDAMKIKRVAEVKF